MTGMAIDPKATAVNLLSNSPASLGAGFNDFRQSQNAKPTYFQRHNRQSMVASFVPGFKGLVSLKHAYRGLKGEAYMSPITAADPGARVRTLEGLGRTYGWISNAGKAEKWFGHDSKMSAAAVHVPVELMKTTGNVLASSLNSFFHPIDSRRRFYQNLFCMMRNPVDVGYRSSERIVKNGAAQTRKAS